MKKREKIYNYPAIFEPDIESGGYTVTIPSLPGCISEGNTFEEAQRNIKEAAALYLESMKRRIKSPKDSSGFIIAPIKVEI